jgi:prepilin-type N-terminal cleavage/methylation domain-containing protein
MSAALRRRSAQARGFSFIELVVSMAIMLAVASSLFGFVHSARQVFEIDLERADMQQRARVSLDALFRDLVMAGAGLQTPAIAPFRRGDITPDPPGSGFVDRISIRYLPPDAAAGEAVTITYALSADAAGVPQLTRYDGRVTDLPVADQVAGLRFEYFDAAGQPMAVERFTDGPWIPDAAAADRFDADLEAIRRVRALLRVRPARTFAGVPLDDLEAAIDVSPRNLNLQ